VANNPVGLSALSAAAEARRAARRRLRDTTADVAQSMVNDLRVGDSVNIMDDDGEPATYVVESVTWRAWRRERGADPDETVSDWPYTSGITLTRIGTGREPFSIIDCRYGFVDEETDATYKVADRNVYVAGVETLPIEVWEDRRRHLATDDELKRFTAEAARVASAFAEQLASETADLAAHVDRMLDAGTGA
jgi:hypothetical protein